MSESACVSFQAEQIALTFSAQICPKMGLGLQIPETNVVIRISILKILCMSVFRQNKQL